MIDTSVYTITYRLKVRPYHSRQVSYGFLHHVDCYAGIEEAYQRMAEDLEEISAKLEADHHLAKPDRHDGYFVVEIMARKNGIDTRYGSIENIEIHPNTSRYWINAYLLSTLNHIKSKTFNDLKGAA